MANNSKSGRDDEDDHETVIRKGTKYSKLPSPIFLYSTKRTHFKNQEKRFKKTLFVLEIFIFLYFFPSYSTVSRFKGSDETGIIMAS